MQAHFGAPDAYTAKYSMTELQNIYNNQIRVSLENACTKIISLQASTFGPMFYDDLQTDKSRELIFTIVLWTLGLLLILLFHFFYFGPIYTQRSQTINMIRIMPTWLVERSPEACRLVCK